MISINYNDIILEAEKHPSLRQDVKEIKECKELGHNVKTAINKLRDKIIKLTEK